MKNQNQKTYESDDFEFDDEELFCETYDTDDFETALSEFNSELDECTCDSESDSDSESDDESEHEQAVFDGDDDEFDGWLKTHKGDDALLCWLWDADCGPSGPDGFCSEIREGFGQVTLEAVRLHAQDLKSDLEG